MRKKTEFKQLPRGYGICPLPPFPKPLVGSCYPHNTPPFASGAKTRSHHTCRYAEVLENTQFALVATVQKLYSMVRNGQQWDLGEPDLNDRGQPVIHNIAQKLGCIRPNSDMDLPVHSVFPEDEQGLADLASQLEAQQRSEEAVGGGPRHPQNDRASSSDLDHSDFEDYRKAAFGGHGGGGPASSTMTLSPASLTYDSFDSYSAPASEGLPSAASPTNPIPPTFAPWMRPPPPPPAPPAAHAATATMPGFDSQQFVQPSGAFASMDLFSQGLLESEFGTIKPHVLNCPNPEVMMGVGDPMIYSGFDVDAMRL